MTKEGCTKIVNFMNPQAGVLVQGCGHMSCSENALSSTLSLYSTLIVIVLRDYDAAFLCYCWFLFILWWGCWYAWTLLSRHNCKVSYTQVTVKARGPLISQREMTAKNDTFKMHCVYFQHNHIRNRMLV